MTMQKKTGRYISFHKAPKIGERAVLDVLSDTGYVKTVTTTPVEHTVLQPNGKYDIITKNTVYRQV